MRDALGRDILIIDWKTAGSLPQPFEQHHNENIVVFEDRVEHRRLEQLELGMTKYVVHTETFEAPPRQKIDEQLFLDAFKRAYKLDPVDVRKCIRWALKGSFSRPSVV